MTHSKPPARDANTEREDLLHEHEELVQLFIHEDSMAWQLSLGLLAGNAVVVSGVYSLGLLDANKSNASELIAIGVVIGLGILLNLVGFFVLQRSKIHRLSRLFRAYAVENRLRAIGSQIATFTSAEGNLHRKVMLRPSGTTTRPLRCHEQVEALGFRFILNVLSILMVSALVWLVWGRPWLAAEATIGQGVRYDSPTMSACPPVPAAVSLTASPNITVNVGVPPNVPGRKQNDAASQPRR